MNDEQTSLRSSMRCDDCLYEHLSYEEKINRATMQQEATVLCVLAASPIYRVTGTMLELIGARITLRFEA